MSLVNKTRIDMTILVVKTPKMKLWAKILEYFRIFSQYLNFYPLRMSTTEAVITRMTELYKNVKDLE